MNLQHLLPILKGGYSYNVGDADTLEQVYRPPNTYMLQAAKAIEELLNAVQQRDAVIQNLHNQLQNIANYEQRTAQSTRPSDSAN